VPYQSLSEYITALSRVDEIRVIDTFVNPELEITEITDRISKEAGGGKALLFKNNGTNFPLLINSFGSLKRICLALGVQNLDETGDRIKSLMDSLRANQAGFFGRIKLIPRLGEISSYMPRSRKGPGRCQEVIINDPDLSVLPVLKCWPYDGGRFITLPLVHTIDPLSGIRNVGMYRMQIMGPKETAMHWHRHKTGARHFEEYKRLGIRMPIAVALGGDPVYTYAATAPLPDQLDEYILAGFIRKKSVELVRCITQNIEVPADADIIIEGYVDPVEEFVLEGPFGDHTGFYSLADYYPRFHVTCITHQKNAVYPATIVGIPPQEDAWIAKATEHIFLFPIRLALVPELIDLHMPDFGVAHNLAIVKIKKTYPGQAIKVMNALWGAGQMMFNKFMIITDCDFPLTDYGRLLNYMGEHVNLNSDIHFSSGPLDVLDHSARVMGFGGKLGIDATQKFPEEEQTQLSGKERDAFPDITYLLNNITDAIHIKAFELSHNRYSLLVSLKDTAGFIPAQVKEIFNANGLTNVAVIILGDSFATFDNFSYLLWYCLNNTDPGRDCTIVYNLNSNNSILCIDSRRKISKEGTFLREWPNIIVSEERTISAIDDRWDKLKIGTFIPSPSLQFNKLVRNKGAIANGSNESS
jgi:4-hydroxy-3-polyprenylbenzoate decarboxylase